MMNKTEFNKTVKEIRNMLTKFYGTDSKAYKYLATTQLEYYVKQGLTKYHKWLKQYLKENPPVFTLDELL